jgi:cbb3-type cytochrome oxidase subunit 1
LTIFFAASLIPLMAAAMNVFQTARSNWSAASNSPGTTSVMLGMFLLVASAAGSLFTASDAHSAGDITHMQAPLESLFLWGAMGMIALGGAITCFPAASGRALHSNQTSRTVMWMFAGGATIAFLLSMSAAMTHAAMAEVITANDELELLDMSAVNDLNTLSSIAFYAVAIGAIFMMLNMIRGHFSGSIIGTSSPSGLTAPRMALTPGTTTIRQLLAAGAGIDTEIDVISDAEADEEE